MKRLATLRRRVANALDQRLTEPPPTPHPSPAWGCCGCGAAEADVVSLELGYDRQPCQETYCWGCVPGFYTGVRYEVFPGRQRHRTGRRTN